MTMCGLEKLSILNEQTFFFIQFRGRRWAFRILHRYTDKFSIIISPQKYISMSLSKFIREMPSQAKQGGWAGLKVYREQRKKNIFTSRSSLKCNPLCDASPSEVDADVVSKKEGETRWHDVSVRARLKTLTLFAFCLLPESVLIPTEHSRIKILLRLKAFSETAETLENFTSNENRSACWRDAFRLLLLRI